MTQRAYSRSHRLDHRSIQLCVVAIAYPLFALAFLMATL